MVSKQSASNRLLMVMVSKQSTEDTIRGQKDSNPNEVVDVGRIKSTDVQNVVN